MEVDGSASAKVTTLSIRNAKATISVMTTHPLHASESGALPGCQHRQFGHLRTNVSSHMAKKGLANRMEISGGRTTSGPCDPCLKGKQTHKEIRKTVDARADCALNHAFADVCGPLATQPH